ncbi:hypothetical protein lbkm_3313 [Lachnospiraceae bacterium KM106-2]|nr:hypothetical protein lbkm_3313 [Lachnospiraceae bacterium KM106-2]
MKIFEQLGVSTDIVLIGTMAFSFLLFILVIVLFVKSSKMKRRYNAFMNGADGKSLEEVIQKRFDEIDAIKEKLEDQDAKYAEVKESLLSTYQKIGIVKYDAFKEMGGKLSFAMALLDAEDNGFIINSMHSSREGCYTYIKEVLHGESYVVLAEEEQQALDDAVSCKKLIRE